MRGGYKVMISGREKTAIDCIDRPALAGGVGEAATILATAGRRFDWTKATDYLERIGSGALARRFGWLADHVEADVSDEVRKRLLQLAALSRKTLLPRDPACPPAPLPKAPTSREHSWVQACNPAWSCIRSKPLRSPECASRVFSYLLLLRVDEHGVLLPRFAP